MIGSAEQAGTGDEMPFFIVEREIRGIADDDVVQTGDLAISCLNDVRSRNTLWSEA